MGSAYRSGDSTSAPEQPNKVKTRTVGIPGAGESAFKKQTEPMTGLSWPDNSGFSRQPAIVAWRDSSPFPMPRRCI